MSYQDTGLELVQRVCWAAGLDPSTVVGWTLTFDQGGTITLAATLIPSEEQLRQLATDEGIPFEKLVYQLIEPKEDPQVPAAKADR